MWTTPLVIYLYYTQAEVSELAHYEAMGFVDHPHPGQGGDFDDEAPITLPEEEGKDKGKGGKAHIQTPNLHYCPLVD